MIQTILTTELNRILSDRDAHAARALDLAAQLTAVELERDALRAEVRDVTLARDHALLVAERLSSRLAGEP